MRTIGAGAAKRSAYNLELLKVFSFLDHRTTARTPVFIVAPHSHVVAAFTTASHIPSLKGGTQPRTKWKLTFSPLYAGTRDKSRMSRKGMFVGLAGANLE